MRKVLLAILLALMSLPAAADEITVVTINVWSGIDYMGTLKMGEYESTGRPRAALPGCCLPN